MSDDKRIPSFASFVALMGELGAVAPRRLTLDEVLSLVAAAKDAPAPHNGPPLVPAFRADGIEVCVSDYAPVGTMIPLGPRQCVVSREDYERVRGRKVIPFPVKGGAS